jgi:hypothetical protein
VAGTVRVRGLKELHRDFKKMSKELGKEVDRELKAAAAPVREDAASRFQGYSPRSASGYRVRSRGFGQVAVQQSRRKTTGQRPDFGSLQMRRALLPALYAKEDEVHRAIDRMLGRWGGEYGF